MDDATETELYYAIDKNQPEKIKKLLENGLDPNVVFNGYDPVGKTWFWSPLHLCSEKGRVECAKLLLEYGADTQIGDRWCMTPLMYAVRTEWHNMVQVFLEHPSCNIDCQDSRGRTSVHIAAECYDDICLRMLCEAGADVNHQDLVGRTAVWQTVTRDGRTEHLARLLEHGCEVNIQDKRDKRIPLQEAIAYSDKDCLKYVTMLLKAGSDVNHRDEANLNSMLNLQTKLIRKGKDADDEELEIAKLLIEAGYRLNDKGDRTCWHKYGGGALHKAAEQGSVRLLNLFLLNGANPDIVDDSGVTPLLAAVVNDHNECAIQLLRNDCHPDLAGEIKCSSLTSPASPLAPLCTLVTPVHCALSRGNMLMVYWLVNYGARCQPADLLHLMDRHQEQVEALVARGATNVVADLVTRAFGVSDLFEMCVFKIRRLMGADIRQILSTACLPRLITDSLLLQHLHDSDGCS